ncbi:hypothetical protein [Ktedonospora formicarum]|uniref:Uncharacterized protein n=1 Tax=Ktedonospora formicarum TaxID=2778364 RepID=A0A8J3I8D5_9CHLR|nr:hypothetical protein [Ktedonospora formicarum]GHO49088.1 hypothetical protein KSX_72510 [Ktedonospora formicarum]
MQQAINGPKLTNGFNLFNVLGTPSGNIGNEFYTQGDKKHGYPNNVNEQGYIIEHNQ